VAAISDLQEELEREKRKHELLQEHYQPPAFFQVTRVLDLDGENAVAEQPIGVRVELTNIGKRGAAQVYYREEILGMPIEVLDGNLIYEGAIEAGETVSWGYSFCCTKEGLVRLSTGEISYDGRHPYWDQIEPESEVQINPGSPPNLVVTRAYRPVKEGLSVLIRLENRGEMKAQEVQFAEPWPLLDAHSKSPQVFKLDDGILGIHSAPNNVETVKYTVAVKDRAELVFDQPVEVIYWDSKEESYRTELAPTCDELAYDIPPVPPIVGRSQELEPVIGYLENLVRRDPGWSRPARLILVDGPEGSGKTRFCREIVSHAARLGYQCF
jgi:hypothetical protein